MSNIIDESKKMSRPKIINLKILKIDMLKRIGLGLGHASILSFDY